MNLYDSRILLVEDEIHLQKMIEEFLNKSGFKKVDTASTVKEAECLFRATQYHLVILDVMLPDGNGFALFEGWRKAHEDMRSAVIFLSARDEDRARLKGLGLGADDYITKPFLFEELLLRIKAVLKRTWQTKEVSETVRIGKAEVDFEAGSISLEGKISEMTAKEFLLLQKLCDNRGRIVSMNCLMDTLWPDGSYGYENSLMVHIRRLREKLEENPSKPEYLLTVRGLGYKLK